MAEPAIGDPPEAVPTSSSSLPPPEFDIPFDPHFFSFDGNPNLADTFNSDFDLDFDLDNNGAFELNFDDIDGLCLPDDNGGFILPPSDLPPGQTNSSSGSSGISADRGLDVSAYLNQSPSESGSFRSAEEEHEFVRGLDIPSLETDDSGGPEFSGGPVSSQGSGNGLNSASPECGNSGDPDVSSDDRKVKVEQTGNRSAPKRKKEQEDVSAKTLSKCRKSSPSFEKSSSACSVDGIPDEEDKRKVRLMRNRESAQLSRQRKKNYVEELEAKVRSMHSTIADLNNKVSFMMAENVTLRQQLGGGGGMCLPPHTAGMYPPPPMAYPWMPCAPYVMKPQGSQVPLVPIPRLKPQHAAPAPKAKKTEAKKTETKKTEAKQTETKKTETKTKSVTRISMLGMLSFLLMAGGFFVRFGGVEDRVAGGIGYSGNETYVHRVGGRVLMAIDNRNDTHHTKGRGFMDDRRNDKRGKPEDESVNLCNGSEPLVASLYVPRNDKLVKIDGNLIIHSVLASEKAKETPEVKSEKGTDPEMLRNFASALAIPEARRRRAAHAYVYRNHADRRRALAPGSDDPLKDHVRKSVSANGKVQQWFREGLAGPMLSSGMCSEVFQFDVAPSSTKGAIISAPSVRNITAESRHNGSQASRGQNRRSLRGSTFPLSGSEFNETGGGKRESPSRENLPQGNNSLSSSMVVSVLLDPREAVDIEVDGVVPPPKSLSRIFVVVLIDSIKYVTYSCVLPGSGGPQLVTT